LRVSFGFHRVDWITTAPIAQPVPRPNDAL
jgi:hypothetical protein